MQGIGGGIFQVHGKKMGVDHAWRFFYAEYDPDTSYENCFPYSFAFFRILLLIDFLLIDFCKNDRD